MRQSNLTSLEVVAVALGLYAVASHFHAVLKQMILEPNLLDFAYYYVWGDLVHRGINFFNLFSLTPEHLQVLQTSIDIPILQIKQRLVVSFLPEGFALYSPSFLAFMSLFAQMTFAHAAVLWTVLNYLFLIFSIYAITKAVDLELDVASVSCLTSLVFFCQPLIECIGIGQSNLLILLFLSTSLWAITRERSFVAGLLLACAIHIKPQYGLIALLLLMKRLHGPLMWTVISYWGVVALTLLIVPLEFQFDYFATLLGIGKYASILVSWSKNLSLLSALVRILGEDHVLAAGIIYGGLCTVLVIFTTRLLWVPYKKDAFTFDFASAISVILLLLPVLEEHYLVLLYLPLIVVYSRAHRLNRLWKSVFIIAFLLIALRYSLAQFPVFHSGILSLFYNGKLCGLILIFAVTLYSALTAYNHESHEGH